MTMIDFEAKYTALSAELAGNQKKLDIKSALGVYYGLSKDGNMRLAFMSVSPAPKIESTKMLRVTQGEESKTVYWTCFDLLQPDAKKVFFTFCENLIEAVTDITDEQKALTSLKKRYITWKTMFKRDSGSTISRESLQGLYGELYFLKKYMLDKYTPDIAISAWSGPDAKSKDFAVGDEWYEVKTPGANATTVRISSLTQLSSATPGHLVIVKVESMSDQFNNGEASVGDLFKYILGKINDETLEGIFLSKLSAYGFDASDESFMAKFDVKSLNLYKVDANFPRLTEADVPYVEICDVPYSLIINSLKPYLEE
jgi:hypothetical protein